MTYQYLDTEQINARPRATHINTGRPEPKKFADYTQEELVAAMVAPSGKRLPIVCQPQDATRSCF